MTLDIAVVAAFVLFCRIGGCIMTMPGFSSPRLPARVRLVVAGAITLGLAPLLIEQIAARLQSISASSLSAIVLAESVFGATLGLIGRIMFAALETLSVAAAMSAGFGNVFGARVDDSDSIPEFASLITFFAMTMFFITDQHSAAILALADSYSAFAPFDPIDSGIALTRISRAMEAAFPLALQITSPFMLYGISVNVAFGLVNRIAPQIPVYFVSMPFVIAGGLYLLFLVIGKLLALFAFGLQSMLAGN